MYDQDRNRSFALALIADDVTAETVHANWALSRVTYRRLAIIQTTNRIKPQYYCENDIFFTRLAISVSPYLCDGLTAIGRGGKLDLTVVGARVIVSDFIHRTRIRKHIIIDNISNAAGPQWRAFIDIMRNIEPSTQFGSTAHKKNYRRFHKHTTRV